MNISTMSRSTRRLAAGSLLALTAAVGLAACGDDEPAQQMEDSGSDVMTESTEAMMEDDAMTESTEAMTDESMTESTDAMTEATTAP